MNRHLKIVSILLGILIFAPNVAWAHSKSAFHDDMRKLWIDHVAWTRLYIISVAGNLPDTKPTTQRLLDNQRDIGNAVVDFYGRPAADQLTALLKDHILIAAELVGAAKAADDVKTADAKKRWYSNANDIAAFLHKANPTNWPEATMRSAMKTHLDQTLDEATHRLQGKYDDDVRDYDEIVKHILMMADTLSSGIIKQFPAKFDKP